MRFVAVHGVPLGPRSYSRLTTPLVALSLRGLTTPEDRPSWSLRSFVDEVAPLVDRDTVLIGPDLGGVIAAMVALERPARGVILTGTALGPYWAAVRATAHPALSRYFYDRHQGRRFVAGGVSAAVRDRFVAEAEPDLAAVPDLADRMRRLALEMSAIVAHELLHYCEDWREAPCFALEGFYRAEMTERILTNPVVQFVLLATLGGTEAPSWGLGDLEDGCFTISWPCATTWSPVSADRCGEVGLRGDREPFVGCTISRHK